MADHGCRQLSFIEFPETDILRRWHRLSDGFEFGTVSANDIRHMDSGIEIIIARPGRDASGAQSMERNHYYRAVTKRVRLSHGEDVRLVSAPTDEWPEKPPWSSWGSDGQWTMPGWGDWYFVRKGVGP